MNEKEIDILNKIGAELLEKSMSKVADLSIKMAEFTSDNTQGLDPVEIVAFFELMRVNGEENIGNLRDQVPNDLIREVQQLVRNNITRKQQKVFKKDV